MKKKDVIVLLCVAAVVAVFFVFPAVYEFYNGFNARHGLTMSFLKFALLSTFGECVGLRITHGVYSMPGFGIAPRALVWGVLGVGISMAMTVFAAGVPALLASLGMDDAPPPTLYECPFPLNYDGFVPSPNEIVRQLSRLTNQKRQSRSERQLFSIVSNE